MTTIDGKYGVLRELSRYGNVTLSEVRAAEGVTRQVAWFDISTPADRQAFHAYRSVLRALNPAGLTDIVARPGAYYAVWQTVGGLPLEGALAQPKKRQETVDNVRTLAARLAEHGYALSDADIMLEGDEPRIAYLRALQLPRTPEDIAARNAPTLAALNGGRIKRPRQPGAWLTFIPGLLFLGGAVYLGAQAAQIYLNPPVREVAAVGGQDARTAAKKLTADGFRVAYTEGQVGNQGVGTIIRQEPAAGTNLPIGRLITLTVNNPPSVEVPKLEEQNLDQARNTLKDRSMVLGKVLKVDGTLTNTPEGRIVSQLPEAGSPAQRGQPVQVMVSTGISGKETWLPSLTGLTVDQAREYARTAGLVITKVSEQPSDKPPGSVLEQTPAPFVRVEVGGPVTLTVAVARYSPPSRPAGSLPLPPPPEPETPESEVPSGPQPLPQEATPEPLPQEQIPAPQEPADTTVPTTQEGSATVPDAETGTPETTAPETRSVSFEYTFPADLPAGTYSVVVSDANGERQILQPTDASQLAGRNANSSQPIQVVGDAVFIVRQDGADYATVNPN
ncbi:PASTA domain-containing protein [Deinococcus humi]|uniref:Beta-lactam-binding protein with PASTA domain n=1 Tax=Deinococcus humi TaxID=662880 RepID=A0A7W8JVX6_9DEIO|nr:PASTA domain-containing protein [Deinococcus humi]MBB5362619.1 beta-lactam-binding protein with PASTA domain [Deinococcus humi]GGO31357.1 PASTA domain-containing protein [Deinococcus humi]